MTQSTYFGAELNTNLTKKSDTSSNVILHNAEHSLLQRLTPVCGMASGSFSISNLENDDYHNCLNYLSATNLKQLYRSAAHFEAWKCRPASAPTASQRIGTALHSAVLEPDRFAAVYCVFNGARRGRLWQDFKTANSAAEILSESEYAQVIGMRDAVLGFSSVDFSTMLNDGCSEESIFWCDKKSGEQFRARCDLLHPDVILDLKTTTDARPHMFVKQAQTNAYEIQAAHYVEGVEKLTGEIKPFWFVAVEIDPPHGVWIHESVAEFIALGKSKIHQALQNYRGSQIQSAPHGYANPWTELNYGSSRR